MINVSDELFSKMLADGIDAIPDEFASRMKNIAITWDYQPTKWQRLKTRVGQSRLLLGLYEGIPLTGRTNNYSLVLPDKITIFKKPLEQISVDEMDLANKVKHTVWHEIAHHFGLSDAEIHHREQSNKD